MTTTGEYLLSKSTLPSGTALAHLLALQTGSGTVFASMFAVRIDEPTLSLVQRAKREAAESVERSSLREENEHDVSILTAPARMSLLTTDECLTVSAGTHGASFVVRLDEGRMTVRQKGTAEMIDG